MPELRRRIHGSLGACTFILLAVAACGPDESFAEQQADRDGTLSNDGVVQGHFESRIAQMLDGTSRISHHLRTDGHVYELILADDMQPPAYDSVVAVSGDLADDGRLVVDDLTVVIPPNAALIDPEFRPPRRIGVVLVSWEGATGLPNGVGVDAMFGGNESTNVYYGEISYGIETMAGKVFGPYQINAPGNCNVDFISAQAELAMMENGWDPSDYRQMAYHFPGGLGCGFAGLASIGSPDNPARNSWYSGSFGCTTRNQELGHNYGMGHSHAYSCPPTPEGMDHNLYEDCEHIEYGHPYDPMGNGCGHMNVAQKRFMGWLDDCNTLYVTSDGTFNLLPTEWPCDGTQALAIPSYDGRSYFLEYRNGDTDFGAGTGVLVHVAGTSLGFGPASYVLDELGANENGYLHEGDSFTDPGGSATFTILEEHDTHVVIDVTFPDGGDGNAPQCEGDGEPGMAGGHVGSLECTQAPYPGDDQPPEVTITYPNDGDVFAPGSSFTITADATDDRVVVEAELYLNGESFNVLTEPPWEWNATEIPEGTYEFGVVARDARYWSPSQAVLIHVTDAPPGDDDAADDSGGSDEGDDGDGTGDETGGVGDETPADGVADDGDGGEDTGDESGDTGDQTGADEGCACRSQRAPAEAPMGLVLLALGLRRRRR